VDTAASPSMIREEPSGREVPFQAVLRVGRHPGNDLVLPDDQVSGHHAVIEYRRGRWVVRDLGSRNGTSVNGRRIRSWKALDPDDVLRFAGGSAWRIVRLTPSPDSQAAQALPTIGGRDADLTDLELALSWDGPANGVVEVRFGDATTSATAGLPFVLLDFLAREPGAWMADSDLKAALWGRQASRLSRSAFHALLHETRELLAHLGASRAILEKRFGRTRLGLGAGQVRRQPVPGA
jgi:hypothetical protein